MTETEAREKLRQRKARFHGEREGTRWYWSPRDFKWIAWQQEGDSVTLKLVAPNCGECS